MINRFMNFSIYVTVNFFKRIACFLKEYFEVTNMNIKIHNLT